MNMTAKYRPALLCPSATYTSSPARSPFSRKRNLGRLSNTSSTSSCSTRCLKASLSITSLNQMIPLILINTALQRQKIREQFLPFSRHDRFRMKLHALDFQLAMAQTHDDAVNSTRRDL